MALWKIPECFFCAEKLENLASGKSGGKSGKLDAENLAENLRVWKICGSCTAAENLRKNPLTGKSADNLENLENLKM